VVERLEGAGIDKSLSDGVDADRTVRLVPANEAAGALTVAFSRFPGLVVRFGEWHVEAYPACGCDACDEDPLELVHKLDEHAHDLVTGQFNESIGKGRKTWLSFRFSTSSGASLLHEEEPPLPRGADRHWQPWFPRNPRLPAEA
jgi:hypothetical protein